MVSEMGDVAYMVGVAVFAVGLLLMTIVLAFILPSMLVWAVTGREHVLERAVEGKQTEAVIRSGILGLFITLMGLLVMLLGNQL
jgi:hypothetical protein